MQICDFSAWSGADDGPVPREIDTPSQGQSTGESPCKGRYVVTPLEKAFEDALAADDDLRERLYIGFSPATRYAINGTIQWLGSSDGQKFLIDALKQPAAREFREKLYRNAVREQLELDLG